MRTLSTLVSAARAETNSLHSPGSPDVTPRVVVFTLPICSKIKIVHTTMDFVSVPQLRARGKEALQTVFSLVNITALIC